MLWDKLLIERVQQREKMLECEKSLTQSKLNTITETFREKIKDSEVQGYEEAESVEISINSSGKFK